MVDRASQPVQISSGNTVQAQQSGSGYVGADPNKFRTSQSIGLPGAGDSSADRILQTVLGIAGKIGNQVVEQSREEAILSGVRQAGTVENESQLESNIFTKAWTTAGYRDTVGRLAAADNEAQIAEDMHTMREKPPEEYAQYLAEKRNNLLGSFEGMTLDSRKTLFVQTMMNDRAAIKKHGAEHYKYIVDTETKSVQTAVYTTMQQLNAAKAESPNGDALAVYGAATDAAYTTALSSILKNPKLPTDVKGKLLTEFAAAALESDNTLLFKRLQDTPVEFGDGTAAPMLTMASPEAQIGLSKAYRESQKRTEVYRAADYMDNQAKMQADWGNPNTEMMPLEQVRTFADEGVRRGLMGTDQYKSFMQDYYTKSEKKVASLTLAQAYVAGDSNKFLNLGKTSDEGLTAYVETLGRKMTLPEITSKLMVIGNTTGQENAFKKVGEINAAAFAQLGNRDTIDPANAASMAGIMQQLDAAEKGGQAGAFNQFLTAFHPDVQAKITYMRESLREGSDPVTAVSTATAKVLADKQTPPDVRNALAVAKAKDIREAAEAIEPKGLWGMAVLGGKAVLGMQGAAGEYAITSFEGWTSNRDRLNEVMATGRNELAKKMTQIATQRPSLEMSSVRSMALADVAGRTVGTDWGPLVVPDGFTPQRYFGVGADVGADRISAALKEVLKPADGNKVAFSVGPQGELAYRELNERGALVRGHILDPKSISEVVQKQREQINEAFNKDYGSGVEKTVQVGDKKLAVRYNGDNTANVENAWMRNMRGYLVEHEGIRDVPYTDLSGRVYQGKQIMTVGVGVSSHNENYPTPGPDGKITPEQINKSFMAASDSAAKAATRLMTTTRTTGEAFFQLYGQLAYQSGNQFANTKAYKPMMEGIMKRDAAAAEAGLKESPAYTMSPESRKQFYLKQLRAAMKG